MKLKYKWIAVLTVVIVVIALGAVIGLNFKRNKDTTPANMNFVIEDTLKDGDNKKVKVFLLAGQSNASGVASVAELDKNIDKVKFDEYSEGYENIYINYYNDNGNNASNGFVIT